MSEFKTEFIQVSSREEAPAECVTNLTRPNLFGCYYMDNSGEIKRDPGLMESEKELAIFAPKLSSCFIELLMEKSIVFRYKYGMLVYTRKADVTVYYVQGA